MDEQDTHPEIKTSSANRYMLFDPREQTGYAESGVVEQRFPYFKKY